MWVGRILLGEKKLKNNTPCDKYEYSHLLQRIKKQYNEYKEIILRKINPIKVKWQVKRAEKKFRKFNKTEQFIQWDKEMLERVWNNNNEK
jgi:hypothetical protein